MRKIILVAAICVFVPNLGWAETAVVPSGKKTQITRHSRFDAECRSNRVEIKLLQAARNGTVTSEPIDYVVPAELRGVKQPAQCVGKTIKGVAVFYQSKPGFTGNDSFRYSRTNADKADDRFNAEVSYSVTVK